MNLADIAIAALQIYFSIMDQMGKTEEEQKQFMENQRLKFNNENAPGNLPIPPA